MDWIENTLREFGRQLGIPPDALPSGPELRLQFDDGGELVIEPSPQPQDPDLLVYRTVPVGYQAGRWLVDALARCHRDTYLRHSVQVGLRGRGPEALGLALVRLPARDFTPQALGEVVEQLGRWQRSA